jgi:hypothetical protein
MASSPPEDETAGMGKTNRLVASRDESNLWGARPEKTLPSLRGLEIRNDPVAGEVFFLDFPLYRTSRDLSNGARQRINSEDPKSDIFGNLDDGCDN